MLAKGFGRSPVNNLRPPLKPEDWRNGRRGGGKASSDVPLLSAAVVWLLLAELVDASCREERNIFKPHEVYT